MRNIKTDIKGKTLIITIDLEATRQRSASSSP